MIRRVIECETCKKQIDLPMGIDALNFYQSVPETWLTLVEGNPQTHEAQHFCSASHLYQWFMALLNKNSGEA
ncbi:MAG: hypothetical protein ACRDHW_00205 [Ktedonobacteraceae bacterium]